MLRIIPISKSYEWGKIGLDSKVASLASSDDSFKLDPKSTYAEVSLYLDLHVNMK